MNNRQKRILIEMSQTNGVWIYSGADVDWLIEAGYIKKMPHGRVKLTDSGKGVAMDLINRSLKSKLQARGDVV